MGIEQRMNRFGNIAQTAEQRWTNMRLIDVDELLKEFEDWNADLQTDSILYSLATTERQLGITDAIVIACQMPTIEAKPVRHSKWIPHIVKICGVEHEFGMKCERCGEGALNAEGDDFLTDYCPHCGARMDEDEID